MFLQNVIKIKLSNTDKNKLRLTIFDLLKSLLKVACEKSFIKLSSLYEKKKNIGMLQKKKTWKKSKIPNVYKWLKNSRHCLKFSPHLVISLKSVW